MSYTASLAQSGSLCQIAIKVAAAFVPIYEVIDLNQSGKTNKTADITNLNSTGEEFLATMLSPGSYDMTMNRVGTDPGQQAVLAAFNIKATTPFTVTLPKTAAQTTTGDVFAFSALVEEMDDISNVGPSKQVIAKAKLKVSGPIVFTPGT